MRPAPVTLVTVVAADGPSVEMKASKSSLPEVVVNAGVMMLFDELDRPVDFTTSMPRPPQAGVVAKSNRNSCRARRGTPLINEGKVVAGESIIRMLFAEI